MSSLTTQAQPTSSIVEITPEDAKSLLARNVVHNRKVRKSRVATLAASMRSGEFGLSWDALACSTDGKFINGQHRLHAVIESGLPQKFLLIEGLPPGVYDFGDRPLPRNLADSLRKAGETSENLLAAVIGAMWRFEKTGGVPFLKSVSSGSRSPSVPQAMETLQRHPGLRNHLEKSPIPFKGVMGASQWHLLNYLFNSVDPADAQEFFEGVIEGNSLEVGDARLALRNRFLKEIASKSTKLDEPTAVAFVIRAWNAWRNGESVTRLQWKAGGSKPDRFPTIDGLALDSESSDED